MAKVTRGVRNNNPGNIRKGQPWQGLASPAQRTAEQKNETAFDVFVGPEWGIRAMARTLITYQDKHGLDTVSEIVGRWAPPTENYTGAYIQAVLRAMLVRPGDKLDLHQYEAMRPLVEAIIAHENAGYSYPAAVIDKGLLLAGIEPPKRRVVNAAADKAKTIVAVAGGGTVTIAGAIDLIQQVGPALPVVQQVAGLPPIALMVAGGVAAVAIVAWLVLRRR